jgi:CrcB protein
MIWLAIAVGGAFGAVARFAVAQLVAGLAGRSFPWGTITVNLAGSLLMGLLYALLVERFELSEVWKPLLMVVFLGAFTTYSTYSIETLLLLEQGEWLRAGANILLNAIGCLIAAAAGLQLGRSAFTS